MVWRTELSWRSPERESGWRALSALAISTGATPVSFANAAAVANRLARPTRPTSRAARTGPTPGVFISVLLVDGADPGPGEVDSSFVEQSQGRGVVVQVHLTPVSVDVGRGRGGSVYPVVLAAPAAGEERPPHEVRAEYEKLRIAARNRWS